MDYFEFKERAKADITVEEYELVEAVYMDAPSSVVGTCVGEFVEWYNKNGKMKAVNLLYPVAQAYARISEENRTLEHAIGKAKAEADSLKQKVKVYESIVSDDDLVAKLLENTDRETLLHLIAQKEVQ